MHFGIVYKIEKITKVICINASLIIEISANRDWLTRTSGSTDYNSDSTVPSDNRYICQKNSH